MHLSAAILSLVAAFVASQAPSCDSNLQVSVRLTADIYCVPDPPCSGVYYPIKFSCPSKGAIAINTGNVLQSDTCCAIMDNQNTVGCVLPTAGSTQCISKDGTPTPATTGSSSSSSLTPSPATTTTTTTAAINASTTPPPSTTTYTTTAPPAPNATTTADNSTITTTAPDNAVTQAPVITKGTTQAPSGTTKSPQTSSALAFDLLSVVASVFAAAILL
ncbi:Aste57867_120 [Aphanomyces stellatus]|uniref:Aste57867_120 protein n=1 Tax=Aphanomyces stellatus TaxID=120398 RepID=A0A485K5Y0_9STRA|nr:hypothetical protein As57867_000120 [Aphanomyces stellatus]VFT77346.1 Aste57867_120 [Aphanomyces stellatus]